MGQFSERGAAPVFICRGLWGGRRARLLYKHLIISGVRTQCDAPAVKSALNRLSTHFPPPVTGSVHSQKLPTFGRVKDLTR